MFNFWKVSLWKWSTKCHHQNLFHLSIYEDRWIFPWSILIRMLLFFQLIGWFQVSNLCSKVLPVELCDDPHEDSLWRTPVQVQALQEGILWLVNSYQTPEDTFRRKALPVQTLPPQVLPVGEPEPAHASPRWHPALLTLVACSSTPLQPKDIL